MYRFFAHHLSVALLALVPIAPAAMAQEGERPPIALPGNPLAIPKAPDQDDIGRMADAIRRGGCFIHYGNKDAVLDIFGQDEARAKAVIRAMHAQGMVSIDEEEGMVDLLNCAPVPLAGRDAVILR